MIPMRPKYFIRIRLKIRFISIEVAAILVGVLVFLAAKNRLEKILIRMKAGRAIAYNFRARATFWV